MTPQEIQALAQGIVGTFISSIPTILTQLNQQKKNNQNISGSRAPTDPLENDLHRATVRRIKQERDVTHSLVSLLQSRNNELKHIHKFNTMMVDLIRQQGTYDNLTNRMSSNLKDTIRDSSKEFSKLFEQMHNVGDRAKKINVMMDNAVSEFQSASNTNNGSGMDKIATKITTIMRSELSQLVSSINADQGMSQSDRLSIANQVFAMSNNISALEANPTGTTTNDLVVISNQFKILNEILQKRDETFTPQMKKIISELGVGSSELIQKLEHVEDFYRTYGDAFPEPADLKQLNAQLGDLAHQQQMFNLTGEKTADEVQTFTNQMTNTFNELFPKIDALVAGVKKNTNTLNWKELFTNIKDLDKDKAKNSMDDIEKALPGWGKWAVKGARFLAKVAAEDAIKIAEDQRSVQKYGVNMKKDDGFGSSFLTNYSDATLTGLSAAEMAQWKQENRVTGGVIGGERSATDQFVNMMSTDFLNPNSTKFSMNGKTNQSFSTLIGGDSQYQKETYDSIVRSLAKNGILPNVKNIQTSLTKDNGIMNTAYKLGLLPKELTDFHTSLTESAAYNVTAMNSNSESILDSVDQFQLLGQKLGLSTTATQALTKQMYDDSHKKGADMLKTGIVARIVAKQLGFSDKESAQIGKMNQMQGNMLNQYLAKNPEQGKLMQQFRIKTEQSRQSELVGDSLQAHPMAINAIMESDPALMSNLNMLSGLANNNLEKGQNVNPTNANNAVLNPDLGEYAQTWKSKVDPALNDMVMKGIILKRLADKVAGEGKEIKEGFDNMVIKGAVGAVNLLGAVGILSTNKLKNDPSKRYQEDHTLFTESVKGHVDIGSMDNYQYASDYASLIVEKFDAYAKSKKTETEQLNTQLKTADSTESVVIRELIKQQQDDLIAAFNQSTKAVQQLDKNNTTDAKIHQDLLAKSLIDTKIAIIKPNQRKQ